MSIDQLIDINLGIHQRVCKLVGLRSVITGRRMGNWLLFVHEALTTEILVLTRNLISKGKNTDDICIQKLLWEMKSAGVIDSVAYNRKLLIFKKIQKDSIFLDNFINKAVAHITKKREILSDISESEVESIIERVADFLEEEIYPYYSKKDSISFQGRLSFYKNGFWKETEEFLVKKEIIL
jgi:hypothetical protein